MPAKDVLSNQNWSKKNNSLAVNMSQKRVGNKEGSINIWRGAVTEPVGCDWFQGQFLLKLLVMMGIWCAFLVYFGEIELR